MLLVVVIGGIVVLLVFAVMASLFESVRQAVALMVALPLSLLAGWLVVRFSGGFFMILIFIFAGGAVGGFIARLAKRVMGNRRGRYIPYLVAACIVIGVLFFAWLHHRCYHCPQELAEAGFY